MFLLQSLELSKKRCLLCYLYISAFRFRSRTSFLGGSQLTPSSHAFSLPSRLSFHIPAVTNRAKKRKRQCFSLLEWRHQLFAWMWRQKKSEIQWWFRAFIGTWSTSSTFGFGRCQITRWSSTSTPFANPAGPIWHFLTKKSSYTFVIIYQLSLPI